MNRQDLRFSQLASGRAAKAQGRQEQIIARSEAEALRDQGKLRFRNAQELALQRREELQFALAEDQNKRAGSGFSAGDVGSQEARERLGVRGELRALHEIDKGLIARANADAGARSREFEGDLAFSAGVGAERASRVAALNMVVGSVKTLAVSRESRQLRLADQRLAAQRPSGRSFDEFEMSPNFNPNFDPNIRRGSNRFGGGLI